VPGDGLALAILVSGQIELGGLLELRLELLDLFLLGWPRNLEIVRALAGDSTMMSGFMSAIGPIGERSRTPLSSRS
jgi:hypothetical protein